MPVRFSSLSILLWLCIAGRCAGAAPVDFRRDVAPLLEKHCLHCHHADNSQELVSLSTLRDLKDNETVIPGEPENSPLLSVLKEKNGERARMPKGSRPLSNRQIEVIRNWIAQGALWPDGLVLRERSRADSSWWSLQPVSEKQPPESPGLPNPIDRFVRHRLAAEGLKHAPAADRRTLIRRLYFDLTGLPPTPEEVFRFINNPDQHAYETLVDQLLESKHFGERWARHWMDIAHYADTHGFERDKRRDSAWRYRDYLIRALNADRPYDRFLLEQIAGDVISPEETAAVVATGFLAAGPWDFVGQVETQSPILRRSARALDLDDMVTQVLTATMGLTVNCARCHDHKLDPISQREYYQLVSVFAGLQRGNRIISASSQQRYNTQQQKLTESIDRVSLKIGQLRGHSLDLADITGGGNGFGSGRKGIGIDARTGKVQERLFGDLGNVRPGQFAASSYPFIDGVFVPAGMTTTVSSTGLQASGLPQNSGKAWDMIRNGPVASQFSTRLGDIDYATDGHSLLGLHANAGITFDLSVIRRKLPRFEQMRLSATVGYGGRTIAPSAEFHVFLDGDLKSRGRLGRQDTLAVQLEIPAEARFLTFISTDGGNGYGHDQISLGDPRIEPLVPVTQTADTRRLLKSLNVEKDGYQRELAALGAPPEFYGVVPSQPPAIHLLVRGNPELPAEEVSPGALGFGSQSPIFGDPEIPDAERRLALARWIVAPGNPLTRRVIVNRLWHWHFGQGIVSTPGDFGFGGGRPSHPELLDWLASELLRNHWSLKHIHRLIVTSQTYRMQSHWNPTASKPGLPASAIRDPKSVDSGNRLLWRMNPRRLEAEAIRDSVLAVSGTLNRTMFGPGYRDFNYQEAYAPVYTYRTADSPELWRRSVYRFLVRTTPPHFMTALDCPDPASLTPRRNVTTTAIQSLTLFNNDFMLRQAKRFADRAQATDASRDQQISFIFRNAFGRIPEPEELSSARELVEGYGLLTLCRSVFNASEFVFID